MSFLSILKTVERVAVPIAEVAIPQAAPVIATIDSIFTRLQGSIATAEVQPPFVTAPAKSASVTADFEAALQLLAAGLNLTGHTITYDKAALQDAINHQVAAFNAMAKVKASFTVTDAK